MFSKKEKRKGKNPETSEEKNGNSHILFYFCFYLESAFCFNTEKPGIPL